jgi:hypothetical protein
MSEMENVLFLAEGRGDLATFRREIVHELARRCTTATDAVVVRYCYGLTNLTAKVLDAADIRRCIVTLHPPKNAKDTLEISTKLPENGGKMIVSWRYGKASVQRVIGDGYGGEALFERRQLGSCGLWIPIATLGEFVE